MKATKIFAVAAIMTACICNASAQQPEAAQESVTEVGAGAQAGTQVETETQDYIGLDFAGLRFEVPAGTIVEKGSSLVAKYPDGTFGVSITNTARPSKQKFALEVCRRNVADMRIKNAKVEKLKVGNAAGAMASGDLEGQKVTIIVLPCDNRELTTVILATPTRSEWVEHFLATLKK